MARPSGPRFRYSRWDGTQVGFDVDAHTVLDRLTDDLLYHGDLNAAMRRMMQSGLDDRHGERLKGLREILEQLRQRRQQELDRHDLGGVYDEIAQELREVIAEERRGIDEHTESAKASGDERRAETAEGMGTERHLELDLLPDDLAGRVRSLQSYDFVSSEARQHFEELVERLREQLAQSWFSRMSGAMSDVSSDELQRMKDMLAELNSMLEAKARGEEPDFEGFLARYGDQFPENPQSFDELLEVIAGRMMAMQAMLNSMSPEQRAQLASLAEQLLDDLDLRWQVDQLGDHLRGLLPGQGWDRSYHFSGDQPLSMAEASNVFDQLSHIDQLENLLQGATSPGALAEVDLDRARHLLGEESADSLERLAGIARMLEEAGYVENREGRYELTPHGMRRIGQNALADLFRKLAYDKGGKHEVERTGHGHERTYDTKPYEYGDPFNLHIERTVRNAVRRTGGGTPVRLEPDDFEVEQTEHLVRSSTVLMLDLSLSMPMRDNFLAAKKVAMALHALISGQFPRDYLGLVGFARSARQLEAHELPELSWDFDFGTNMQHGLMLSRKLLARQSGTKQVIMITDGEPTAHLDPGRDEPYFAYPPEQPTIDATLREVARCTREGIRINTFMLDATSYLKDFIEKLTRLNRGRAFFTTPETLGDYVLVDFIEQRRAMRSAGGRSDRESGRRPGRRRAG